MINFEALKEREKRHKAMLRMQSTQPVRFGCWDRGNRTKSISSLRKQDVEELHIRSRDQEATISMFEQDDKVSI